MWNSFLTVGGAGCRFRRWLRLPGAQTAGGIYTVVATNTTTGCTSNMASSATVVVNPLPAIHPVTGGGSYCSGGTGVNVGLGISDTGVNYQLYRGIVAVGGLVPGTGSGLNFGPQTGAGIYTVVATNATTGCTSNMPGSVAVVVNPLPTGYAITGGGNYCTGGIGVHVGTSGSDTGVSYQLQRGGVNAGPAMTGTGAALDFGLETVPGTYTVVATNANGCVNTMTGTAVITISSLPGIFDVTGGGSYCPGGTGVEITLAGSEVGVGYQLYLGATAIGGLVPGSGGSITFGLHTAGTYSVVAVNSSTGCTSNMSGTVASTIAVTVTPGVTIITSSGSDSVCTGTLVTYTALATNGGPLPTFSWTVGGGTVGTGSSYSFVPTEGNIVGVTMTSNATCPSPATATTTVTMTVLPYVTPSVSIVALPGDTVCQGTTVTFIAVKSL